MVSTTAIGSAIRTVANNTAKTKGLKALGLGGITTAAMCLFDFAKVPNAFNLKYNDKAEKVEGLNWESGIKEILKSIPKCAQALGIPLLLGAAAAGASPLFATLAGISALVLPLGGYSILEKLLPSEEERIQEICIAKGIDINQNAEELPLRQNDSYLA